MFLSGVARLGRDIEIRQTSGGQSVANLALAYDYGQKAADGKRPTQWVEAVLWGEQCQRLQAYLTKGTVLTVSLRDLRVEVFDKRDGTQGSKLTGTIMHLEFTPRQKERETASMAPARAAVPRKAAKAAPPAADGPLPFDDDIPF